MDICGLYEANSELVFALWETQSSQPQTVTEPVSGGVRN